jgi:hypothetical protein
MRFSGNFSNFPACEMDVEVLQGSGKPLFSTFLNFSPLCAGGRLRSCSQISGQSTFPAISRIFRCAKWMWKSCKDPGNHFSPLFSTFLHFVLAGGFGVVARNLGNQIFRPFLEFSGVRNGCGSLARIRETTFLNFSQLFATLCWREASEL